MPSVVEPAFCQLLLGLLTGAVAAPTTLYLGLGSSDGSSEVSATDGGNPAKPSGYSRIALPVSSLKVSGGTLTIPTQTWTFSAIPSPTATATNWQLWSAQTGGTFYAAGPLNPAAITGSLTAAASAGTGTITLSASVAAELSLGDILKLGSPCNNNSEYKTFNGLVNGSTTNCALSSALFSNHPSGEAVSRDGQTRTYSTGWVETVNATLQLVNQP